MTEWRTRLEVFRLRSRALPSAIVLRGEGASALTPYRSLELTPEPILVAEGEGRIVFSNEAARSLLALAPTTPLRLRDVLPFVPIPREAMASGSRFRGGIAAAGPEPRAADVEVFVLPAGRETSGRALYLVHDVSRCVEAGRAADDLLYGMAHEIRGRSATADTALPMLSTEALDLTTEQRTALLGRARHSSQRLESLVDDLLSAADVRAGRLVVDPRPTELTVIVNDAVDSVAPSISERGQRVALNLPTERWAVLADTHYARRALATLLANASKYGPKGDVVEVHADPFDSEVLIAVEDHGPGIPPEQQAGIFERFYRARTGDEPEFGLGLAATRRIVEAHGGQIGLYSEPGEGTRVWFTLPRWIELS